MAKFRILALISSTLNLEFLPGGKETKNSKPNNGLVAPKPMFFIGQANCELGLYMAQAWLIRNKASYDSYVIV